jgi:hypothetical protein
MSTFTLTDGTTLDLDELREKAPLISRGELQRIFMEIRKVRIPDAAGIDEKLGFFETKIAFLDIITDETDARDANGQTH